MLWKIIPAVVLLVLWGGLAWVFVRRKTLKRELVADDAVPRPAPRALLEVVLSAVVVGISGLMLYLIFG